MKRMKKLTALALSLVMVTTILTTVYGDSDAYDTLSSWATECVHRAIGLNLVPQNLQSNFNQPITRAEFTALAVYLYQILGNEITGRTTFADTNDRYVEKAAYIGIVSGVGNNLFDPDATLTREQAAVLLSRLAEAIGHPLRGVPLVFADSAEISSWAVSGVEDVVAHGIMIGTGNYMFSPLHPYTREQSIIAILRVFELEVNEPNLPEPLPPVIALPQLTVSFMSQNVQTIRGVTNWMVIDEHGVGTGILSDSAHSLQLSEVDLENATLYLNAGVGDIFLHFNLEPSYVYVRRWNAAYRGISNISAAVYEYIEVPYTSQSISISVTSDRHDYIYEIYAVWPQGSAYFTFRTTMRQILEPSVRVTIYIPDLAFPTALEYIYSDEYNRYYLSAIMSGSIILTFEDGMEVTLREALDQQLITLADLELNGLNIIRMPVLQTHN